MESSRLSDAQIRELAEILVNSRPEELTCDEWLDRVGGYADAIAAGNPVLTGSDLVAQHLSICPECREEFDALIPALRASRL